MARSVGALLTLAIITTVAANIGRAQERPVITRLAEKAESLAAFESRNARGHVGYGDFAAAPVNSLVRGRIVSRGAVANGRAQGGLVRVSAASTSHEETERDLTSANFAEEDRRTVADVVVAPIRTGKANVQFYGDVMDAERAPTEALPFAVSNRVYGAGARAELFEGRVRFETEAAHSNFVGAIGERTGNAQRQRLAVTPWREGASSVTTFVDHRQASRGYRSLESQVAAGRDALEIGLTGRHSAVAFTASTTLTTLAPVTDALHETIWHANTEIDVTRLGEQGGLLGDLLPDTLTLDGTLNEREREGWQGPQSERLALSARWPDPMGLTRISIAGISTVRPAISEWEEHRRAELHRTLNGEIWQASMNASVGTLEGGARNGKWSTTRYEVGAKFGLSWREWPDLDSSVMWRLRSLRDAGADPEETYRVGLSVDLSKYLERTRGSDTEPRFALTASHELSPVPGAPAGRTNTASTFGVQMRLDF